MTQSLEQLDEKIKNISNLNQKLLKFDNSSQIIKAYIDVFDQLFNDGLAENPIQDQIDQLAKNNDPQVHVYHHKYLERIVQLKQLIDSLPDNFPTKNRLLNRILDNCPAEWIDKIKNKEFANEKEEFVAFRQRKDAFDWSNTVEVRTWGTAEEIGNGLKNIIRQKLRGDDVGHASLTMRIPVNDVNAKLIDSYCLNTDGTTKIPYKIKQYGEIAVYEIYWSFWPGKLNTLNEDIRTERAGFAFKTQSNILDSLPPELKERYVLEIQRADIFSNNKTINLSPVALKNINKTEQDPVRNHFIALKMNKYKLIEEYDSISVILNNYLAEDTEFDPEAQWQDKSIQSKSNFLTLIDRFKNELPDKKLIHKILNQHNISREEALTLKQDVDQLLLQKQDQMDNLKTLIKIEAQKIYPASSIIKAYKEEIKNEINELNENRETIKQNFIACSEELYIFFFNGGSVLPDELASQINDLFELLPEGDEKDEIGTLLSIEFLTQEDIGLLLEKLDTGKMTVENQINELVKNKKNELVNIQKDPKTNALQFLERKKLEAEEKITLKKNTLNEFMNTDEFNLLSGKSKKNVRSQAEEEIKRAQNEVDTLSESITAIQLSSNTSESSVMNKHVIRGLPTKNSILKYFNIEGMLKQASELVSKTSAFNLVSENCSTTSMQILNAGAPPELKHMFQRSDSITGDTATNAILSNPQAVYSASHLVSQAQQGNLKAVETIKAAVITKPNSQYNRLMNKLIVCGYDKKSLGEEILKNILNFLTIIPQLVKDILTTENKTNQNPQEITVDLYFNTLNETMKSLNSKLIHTNNPVLAIDAMKEQLQSNPHAIPYFDKDTLKSVRSYILDLQAKDNITELEKNRIDEYQKIIKERDERISCVENAIGTGLDAKTQLDARKDHSSILQWELTKSDKAEKMVSQLTEMYCQLRETEFGPNLLKSNFIKSLDKLPSNEDKLKQIVDHINEKPNTRTAKAWKACAFDSKIITELGLQPPKLPSDSNHYKVRLQEQKQEANTEANTIQHTSSYT